MTTFSSSQIINHGSYYFAKDLPTKDNLGSKSWRMGFLVGNSVMFKISLVDFDTDRKKRYQFLVLENTSL